jgi:altronate dehydratase large subunit
MQNNVSSDYVGAEHFLGYRRPDGRVGVRNHTLILPTVVCSTYVAQRIAQSVPGTVSFYHPYGCQYDFEDNQRSTEIFSAFASHPNVGAALIVSLGCETVEIDRISEAAAVAGKPVEVITIQSTNGTQAAVEKGGQAARKFLAHCAKQARELCPLSEITLATECGSSDGFSGLSANPAVGFAADLVVQAGGSVILSETHECVGAEQLMADRCANESVAKTLLATIAVGERQLAATGLGDASHISTLAPGNIASGLSTIEEKSLGCVHKGGTTNFVEVVQYGQKPTKKGLTLMDTPGFDIESVTALVAGGAQVVAFTTGRGSPTGCPIAPVIKVCSNSETFQRAVGDMDVNAGTIIDGLHSIDEVGKEILQEILAVASGKLTSAENWGHNEFAITMPSSVRLP